MGPFFGLSIAILVCIFIPLEVYSFTTRNNEIKKHKEMIVSPSDTTVSSYIIAFKKTRNIFEKIADLQPTNVHISRQSKDRLRQVQGWEIVKESGNVSASVKEQLKTVLLTNGVPIKP